MKVIISISGEYSAMSFPEDAVVAYERYCKPGAGITLDEYLETLERDGKIELDSEKTGRKVTVTRVGIKNRDETFRITSSPAYTVSVPPEAHAAIAVYRYLRSRGGVVPTPWPGIAAIAEATGYTKEEVRIAVKFLKRIHRLQAPED